MRRNRSAGQRPERSFPGALEAEELRVQLFIDCHAAAICTVALRKTFLARTCTTASSARSERDRSSMRTLSTVTPCFSASIFAPARTRASRLASPTASSRRPSAASLKSRAHCPLCRGSGRAAIRVRYRTVPPSPVAPKSAARSSQSVPPGALVRSCRPAAGGVAAVAPPRSRHRARRGSRPVVDNSFPPPSPSALLALTLGGDSPPARRAKPRHLAESFARQRKHSPKLRSLVRDRMLSCSQAQLPICSIAFCISSGLTSRTWVPIDH